MSFRTLRRFLMAIASVAAWPPVAGAADWPMLGRTPDRNAVSPESGAPLDWHPGEFVPETGQWLSEKSRNVKWVGKLGTWTAGDPVVAGGLVWVGTNNHSHTDADREDAAVLMCFRESDGELLYKYVSPRLPQGRVHDWPYSPINSSPLVEGDRLWFISNRWEMVCLDIGPLISGTGEPRILWKVDMIGDLGIFPREPTMGWIRGSSPAGYKDWIYLITGNGIDEFNKTIPTPTAPSLMCLEKETGHVVWSDNSPGENILQGQWASPLVMEISGRAQCIAPLGDGWIRSFDAVTGKLLWEFDINSKESTYSHFGESSRNSLLAPPVFHDGLVYVAAGHNPADFYDGQGRLVCIDPTKSGDISSELAVDAAGNPLPRRRIQAVDASQGERAIPNPNSGLIWEFTRHGDDFMDAMHRSVTSVAVAEGLVIAVDYSGLVHCFDAKTGKWHWAYDPLSQCVSAPLVVDGKVYITDEDGEVAVLRLSADPDVAMKRVADEFEPIAQINMGSGFFCSPIFANGVLYLATQTHLFAIEETDAIEVRPAESETAALGEWKEWRGPDRANKSPETGLLKEWPEGGPPLVWTVEGLGQGIASVSIADGRIYTSTYSDDSEFIVALDQRTGRLAWATPIGAAVPESPLMRWLSQRTPTLDEDRLYFLSAEGLLFCLDAADGRERWRKSYIDDFQGVKGWWGFCDYPLIDDDMLICTPGGPEATIIALDKLTGEANWKYAHRDTGRNGHGLNYSAIVISEAAGMRQYVMHLGESLVGIAAEDGRLLWEHRYSSREFTMALSPIVSGDSLFLGYRHGVSLLTVKRDGEALRSREAYSTRVSLNQFQDDLIHVGDHIFASDRIGPLCIDARTGEEAWHSPRRRTRTPSVAMTFADGHLYVRGADDTIMLVEASPQEYNVKSSFTLPDPEPANGATTPVVAGGHLYVRDDDRLFAYDIRQTAVDAPRTKAPTITVGFPPAPAVNQRPGRGAARPGPRSVFVPTPQDVVEKMLQLAEVTADDLVYDLGSGDGRIVITAAKEYGSRAVGIEIDAELVGISRAKAQEQGVGELVTIRRMDIFQTDLGDADVVAVYLLPTQLERLIPQFEKLPPGARIVSHQFEIPSVKPDRTIRVTSDEDGAEHAVYLWTTPLKR